MLHMVRFRPNVSANLKGSVGGIIPLRRRVGRRLEGKVVKLVVKLL